MGRAADGQKFREALNDAKHKVAPAGLKQPQRSSRIGHDGIADGLTLCPTQAPKMSSKVS